MDHRKTFACLLKLAGLMRVRLVITHTIKQSQTRLTIQSDTYHYRKKGRHCE